MEAAGPDQNARGRLSRRRKWRGAAAALLCAGFLASPALAAPILTEFTLNAGVPGVTTGTFQIGTPNLAVLGHLAGTGHTYNYASQVFTPSASGSYTFGMSSAPNDTVLILYGGSYNSAAPATNAIAVNDDSDGAGAGGVTMGTCGGVPQLCPKMTQALTGSTNYYVVITTFSAGDPVALPIGFYVYGEPIGVGGEPPPEPEPEPEPSVPALDVAGACSATGNVAALGAAAVIDANADLLALFTNAGLTTDPQVSDAASQTLPLMAGGTVFSIRSTLTGIQRIIQARVDSNRGLSSGDVFEGDENVWMKPFGSWADQNDHRGVSGYDATSYGAAGGIDAAFSSALRLGGAFAYARSVIDSNSAVAPQTARVNVYQLIGYGSHALDEQTEINFQIDGGWNTNVGRREIPFAASVASSSYDGQTAHGGVGIGRSYGILESTSLVPSARIDYVWIRNESYSETGAGLLDLAVDAQSVQALVIGVDGKLVQQLGDRFTLTVNAGVGYDALNENASMTSAFAGAPGAAFATPGINPSPWTARGGIGAAYEIVDGLELTGRYDAEYRSTFLNQTASMKLRWAF